jgi:hypothetical protein
VEREELLGESGIVRERFGEGDVEVGSELEHEEVRIPGSTRERCSLVGS